MQQADRQIDSPLRPGRRRWPWRSAIVVAAVTMAVELGAWGLAGVAGASPRDAVLAALAVSTVWVSLAAPILSAGPQRGLAAWMRGGVTADATAVTLAVLWLSTPWMTFLGAANIYLILGMVAVAAVTVVRCGRTALARRRLAGGVSVALMAAVTTPLWSNGLIMALQGSARQAAVKWLMAVNPLAAIFAATAKSLGFVWSESPVMYRITVLGHYVPVPRVGWLATILVYAGLTSAAVAVMLCRRRTPSPTISTDRPDAP